MYNRVVLVPYKMGSKSAKLLKESLVAEGLRCFRKRITDTYLPKRNDLIIYYGGTDIMRASQEGALNYYRDAAQNKLYAFKALQAANLSTVEWTEDVAVAQTWPCAVARATLTGHSGQGITTHEQGQPLPNVPLYTKYMKKTYECRVHVFNGKVIDAQIKRKKKTEDDTQPDTFIRNIHTGWVYCREDFVLQEVAKELSIAACTALQLDFGAVDLIYNKHYNTFYILEVNTAPGLEGTTLNNYVKAIQDVVNS